MSWTTVELLFWLSCLLVNFWLMHKKKPTISKRVHRWQDQRIDYAIMILIDILVLAIWGWNAVVLAIRYEVIGHWFWHED